MYHVSCAAGTSPSLGIGCRWRQNGIRGSIAGSKGEKNKKRAEDAARPWACRCNAALGKSWLFLGSTGGCQQWQGLARDEHPAQFGALGHARNFGGPQLVPAGRGGDLIGTATPHLLKKVAPTRPREAPSGPLRPVIPRLGRASEPLATGLACPDWPARAANTPNRRDSPAVLAPSRGSTAARGNLESVRARPPWLSLFPGTPRPRALPPSTITASA